MTEFKSQKTEVREQKIKRLGIIAGNRLLPVTLAKNIKEKNLDTELIAFCIKGETSNLISDYAGKTYWFEVGELRALKEAIENEKLAECIMAGQITPAKIFRKKKWDKELSSLIENIEDLRPHTIFSRIIEYLEKGGTRFLDSTVYLKEFLAEDGLMNGVSQTDNAAKDIEFGVKIVSRFADLDIGQTAVIKSRSVVALESLEGTDNAIKRGYRLAKGGCTVIKFSKTNQDLRFDVPVVGMNTLRLLKKIKAQALVLEVGKVIILEKENFLALAEKWQIPVIGRNKI
jgi:DUF1009 family protein